MFLDWVDPPPGLGWADVGCSNGAFTELLFDRPRAAHVEGMDPSSGQLAFARDRLRERSAGLHLGSAVPLPFGDASIDAAASPSSATTRRAGSTRQRGGSSSNS